MNISFQKIMEDFLDEFKYQYINNIKQVKEKYDFGHYIRLDDHYNIMQTAATNTLNYINDKYKDVCEISGVLRKQLSDNNLSTMFGSIINDPYYFIFSNTVYQTILSLKGRESKSQIKSIIQNLQKKKINEITKSMKIPYIHEKYVSTLKDLFNSNINPLLYIEVNKQNKKKLFMINSIFEYVPITESNFLKYFLNIIICDVNFFYFSPYNYSKMNHNYYMISSQKINTYKNVVINDYILKEAYIDIIDTVGNIMHKHNFQLSKLEEDILKSKPMILLNLQTIKFKNLKYYKDGGFYDIDTPFTFSLLLGYTSLKFDETYICGIKSNLFHPFADKECFESCKNFYKMLYEIKTNKTLNKKIKNFLNLKYNKTSIKKDIAKRYLNNIKSKGLINYLVSLKYNNSDDFLNEKVLNYFQIL